MFSNGYPYTDLHELNLDWIIGKMKALEIAMETFEATQSLKFADPIIWNITTQYEKSTVVLDPSGNAYLSLQPVPSGVQLNNTDYWLEIFNFTEYTRTANQNLTVNVETNTTRATENYDIDDWLIWEDVLYKVTNTINVDDLLVVGTNVIHFTVEDFIKAWVTYATNLIQQYKTDIDASELAYNQAMQAQVDRILAGATVDSEVIDARLGADGINYSTLGNAIRTQLGNITGDMEGGFNAVFSDEFKKESYTNPNGSIAQGTDTVFGFKIPYPIKSLTITPSYSGSDGTITATRYSTSGVTPGAAYSEVESRTFLMGDSVTFYNLKETEFIIFVPSNGKGYYNNTYPSSGMMNARVVYLASGTLGITNANNVYCGTYIEYTEIREKIIGGIHATNSVMTTDGTSSYVGSDKKYRTNKYYVDPSTYYRYVAKAKAAGGALICFYDDSNTFLGYVQALNSTLTLYDVIFETPATCAYIMASAYYPDYGILYTKGKKQNFPYAGKLFMCIGDSRTWYDEQPFSDATKYEGVTCHGYEYYLRELGVTTFNDGRSGYTTPQLNGRTKDHTGYSTTDYFIIWTGVNDWQKGTAQGAIDDIGATFDTTTTAGALQDMIEYLINNNTNAKIFIMGNYENWNNNLGLHEPPTLDVLIHSISDLYAIPFLDLLHESRLNLLNRDNFFADSIASNIYLHLGNNGYEYISNIITKYIGNN